MNSTDDRERDGEAARVGRIYAGYARSRRRRRAWNADNPGNRAMRDELLAALFEEARPELTSDGEVLDIGCGTGFWLEALAASGANPEHLSGVDILPERVLAAARRVPGATIRQADARHLPFEDGRFTVVLLFTVLSSLGGANDVRDALAEALRVLRPGGLVLCYEPRLPSPLNGRVRRVPTKDLSALEPCRERRLTLLPPLARRLGKRTETLYPRLASVAALRSHRLVVYRKDEPL